MMGTKTKRTALKSKRGSKAPERNGQVHKGNGRGLTIRQQQFVREYLIDLNATAACKRAGYQCKNDNSAAVVACNLLRNIKIRAAIEEGRRAGLQRLQITADTVANGLLTEATYYGEGSSHAARTRAWELLGKHVSGFFPPEVSTDPSTHPISIQQTIKLDDLPLETVRALLHHHRKATGQPLGCAALPELEVIDASSESNSEHREQVPALPVRVNGTEGSNADALPVP
jgi:phage terminase small subunit